MQFSEVIGQERIIENLRNMVDSGRVPHAILFTERMGYGALHIALATISYMFCQNSNGGDSCGVCNQCSKTGKLVHPDLHFTFPINTSTLVGKEKRAEIDEFYPLWRKLVKDNPWFGEQELYEAIGIENKFGNISVNEANAIMRKLGLSSFEGGIKVMLIMFPERMNQEAANKLLKSLEEPQPDTYYFLISHNPSKIIATILSRCRIIEVPPIEGEVLAGALENNCSLNGTEAAFCAKCSGGSYGKALELLKQTNEESENRTIFIKMIELGIAKDLVGMFDIWESLAAKGKEAQKSFCIEALEVLRKLYMIHLGLDSISYIHNREREILVQLSGRVKKDFFEKGYNFLNSAIESIERNVNPKFIFCDLCNRIYYNA
ncbi:MAG: hypothetical protein IKY70_04100 [Bacteroidales bacterium]|nr:hypothetical protein [Bacteroidales bacterium]